MTQIEFDNGIKTYKIGGGTLRFNPSDPNLYGRFLDALDNFQALEAMLSQGEEAIETLRVVDKHVKQALQTVFGPENDLEPIFGGMNLLAVGDNGHRILENFLSALEPILTEGALRCAREE